LPGTAAFNNSTSVRLTVDTAANAAEIGIAMTRACEMVDCRWVCNATVGGGTFSVYGTAALPAFTNQVCAVANATGRTTLIGDTSSQVQAGGTMRVQTNAAGVRATITVFLQPSDIPLTPLPT